MLMKASLPLTIWGWGFAGSEKVHIELPNRENADIDTNAHWNTWTVGTVAQILDADNNKINFTAPGRYRIRKTAEANANGIGVALM